MLDKERGRGFRATLKGHSGGGVVCEISLFRSNALSPVKHSRQQEKQS